ncbi:uncharacterized protein LOC120002743 isoform X2 [Tripterygium wilfordii]|uniref:uncharacterized protein LOC120002743 isoform X2 n=1 Tax=Tripterygium wilfordii TaxID=458696 RepID=UPI0018F859BB|nr:uncharacterized protein LOC120002743 isoform X2 [Tripterygium wilfordii]
MQGMPLLFFGSQFQIPESNLRWHTQNPPPRLNSCSIYSAKGHALPNYIVGETKSEASKEGRNLADFKYACVGYSIYLENKDSLTDQKNRPAELPFCVGVEVLLDKRPSTAGHVPAHVHKSGDGATVPEHRPTTHSTGEDFLSRFKRSAGLVASGVVRNANRVGNHIKQSLDDMLFRRPK